MTLSRRYRAACAALVLLWSSSQPLVAQARDAEPVEPKFAWGVLMNIAFKIGSSMFTDWLMDKLTKEVKDKETVNKLLDNAGLAGIVPLLELLPLGTKSVGWQDNVSVGEVQTPFTVKQGQESCQGAHVAIVGFDSQGKPLGVRPVSSGFRSGDRIKLKLLATFDSVVVIENINAQGKRQQIYPPAPGEVLKLQRGKEFLLPLGADEYFEFAGATGQEQLLLTIRDPRAFNGQESVAIVKRKDDATGSSFVQDTPEGRYPVMAQSLVLEHGR